jgi:DNA repair and recombination protein RAD52
MSFTEQQLKELDKTLNPLLVSTRKGGSGTTLKYIEGHDAIDQANRIFGYGQWGYRVMQCKPTTIIDPATGEAIGVTYEAEVELTVACCIPVSDVGQQAVSAWNVVDIVMTRRGKDGDKEAQVSAYERQNAQRTIVDAHEVARKGAVTDAVKRCLRTLGNQFGNGLYGDGKVALVDGDTLDEETLKSDWAKVYHIKENEIETRWPRFKVYALQAVIEELTSDHKLILYATIQQQLQKAS